MKCEACKHEFKEEDAKKFYLESDNPISPELAIKYKKIAYACPTCGALKIDV
jgi:hypothetical protein